ncbi:hypothetical protein C427_0822 [Paraglaciecola psychrophila 170]|uniref:Uncharacterized protein n=1 Tax=Paraglaciecola psychrophila 170 TaxID=1129794 RepID=K6ZSR1_9ALTE|nr:hypothetical protein C427_0822 [Paraglaciecola psychrophila 170]GAC38971.1 hypothetical protein GPSY_3360 [Paraglaciecola psychrophila 170]
MGLSLIIISQFKLKQKNYLLFWGLVITVRKYWLKNSHFSHSIFESYSRLLNSNLALMRLKYGFKNNSDKSL